MKEIDTLFPGFQVRHHLVTRDDFSTMPSNRPCEGTAPDNLYSVILKAPKLNFTMLNKVWTGVQVLGSNRDRVGTFIFYDYFGFSPREFDLQDTDWFSLQFPRGLIFTRHIKLIVAQIAMNEAARELFLKAWNTVYFDCFLIMPCLLHQARALIAEWEDDIEYLPLNELRFLEQVSPIISRGENGQDLRIFTKKDSIILQAKEC